MNIRLKQHYTLLIAMLFAVTAWGAYVIAVLSSHQLETVKFSVENGGAVASAVSHVLYHSPLGSTYHDIQKILDQSASTAHGISLVATTHIDKQDFKRVAGSDGIALNLIYTLGMQLFGVNINAIFFIFATFLLIAHLAYTACFYDHRFILAPISLFSLTLMVFMPIVTNPTIAEHVPIAGYRYFTVLAALPMMHVLLWLADDGRQTMNVLSVVCLILQVIIISLCGFVAKSSAYAFIAICIFSCISYYHERKNKPTLTMLLKKIAAITIVLIIFSISFYHITPRAYKNAGAVTDAVWHRVWISLGVNPNWPFDNIKMLYQDCEATSRGKISKGLQPGNVDSNGSCVWDLYVKKYPHALADDKFAAEKYQAVQRDAFFSVLFHNPADVSITFLYYKPIQILSTIKKVFSYHIRATSTQSIFSLIVSAFILALSWFLYFKHATFQCAILIVQLLCLATLSTIAMYIVAWSEPWTSIELIYYLHVLTLMCLMILANSLARIFHHIA